MGWIYLITNKVNRKLYIGQTTRKRVEIRWSQHRNRPKGVLKLAFEKYGIVNFEFSTICEINEGEGWREALDAREILEIRERNTLSPNGYNLETGGNKNKVINQETRKQISERQRGEKNWNFGKHLTEETRKIISESQKGKKRSQETKDKMRESQRGRVSSQETKTKRSKRVEQWTEDRKTLLDVHESIKRANEKLGVAYSSISLCCNGKRNSAGGFFWKFPLLEK
jgi:group I intron endonuclease